MSDLGLSELTDDQLVDLLQEACAELATRNHIVRNAAQRVIYDEAEKMKLLAEAAGKVRKKYIGEIRQQIQKQIEAEVTLGQIRILSPEQEAKIIAEHTKQIMGNLQKPEKAKLFEKTEKKIKREVFDGKRPLFTPEEIAKMTDEAVEMAEKSLRQCGTWSIEQMRFGRQQVWNRLRSHGFTDKEIELIYGRP